MSVGAHLGHNQVFLHQIENPKEEGPRNVCQFHLIHLPGGDEFFTVAPEQDGLSELSSRLRFCFHQSP